MQRYSMMSYFKKHINESVFYEQQVLPYVSSKQRVSMKQLDQQWWALSIIYTVSFTRKLRKSITTTSLHNLNYVSKLFDVTIIDETIDKTILDEVVL